MSPTWRFGLFLGVTVVLLACTVLTGLRAWRRLHVPLALATLVSLGVTIAVAKSLGEHYDLAAAGAITPIHLTIAKVTTALYLLAALSGLRTIFVPATRIWHRRIAFVVLAATAVTAVTGTLMLALAPAVR